MDKPTPTMANLSKNNPEWISLIQRKTSHSKILIPTKHRLNYNRNLLIAAPTETSSIN